MKSLWELCSTDEVLEFVRPTEDADIPEVVMDVPIPASSESAAFRELTRPGGGVFVTTKTSTPAIDRRDRVRRSVGPSECVEQLVHGARRGQTLLYDGGFDLGQAALDSRVLPECRQE